MVRSESAKLPKTRGTRDPGTLALNKAAKSWT